MEEEQKTPFEGALDYANFLINNTTHWNLETQAVVLSELITLFGEEFRNFLVIQFGRNRVLTEVNNLELYAEMIEVIQDDTLREEVLKECVKVVNEILDAGIVTAQIKEKLRNTGSFIGLLTLSRDLPISADVVDFKKMLLDAVDSNNPQRICLMVVLITHVLKYCQRSTIFNKDSTWVSRIIEVLKELHGREGMDVFVCLEIERYLEHLEKPRCPETNRTLSDGEHSGEHHFTDDEDQRFKFDHRMTSSPMPPFTPPEYFGHGMNVELEGHQVVPKIHQPDFRSYTMPTPDLRFDRPPPTPTVPPNTPYGNSSFFNPPTTPLSTRTSAGPNFVSPQRSEVGYNASMPPGTPVSHRELFTAHAASPRPFYPRGHQSYTPSTPQSARPETARTESSLMDLLINRLDFTDAPILLKYPQARAELLENFMAMVVELEAQFIERVSTSVNSFIDFVVTRDLIFCTDERQIRQCYQVTSRALLFTALKTKAQMLLVNKQFRICLEHLFLRVIDRAMLMNAKAVVTAFIEQSVQVFVMKNQQILMDCLLMQLNRRAAAIADAKLQQFFATTKRRLAALPLFAEDPKNFQEVNNRLPAPLRRSFGAMSAADLGIYASFDTIARIFQTSIERGFVADEREEGNEENHLTANLQNLVL